MCHFDNCIPALQVSLGYDESAFSEEKLVQSMIQIVLSATMDLIPADSRYVEPNPTSQRNPHTLCLVLAKYIDTDVLFVESLNAEG